MSRLLIIRFVYAPSISPSVLIREGARVIVGTAYNPHWNLLEPVVCGSLDFDDWRLFFGDLFRAVVFVHRRVMYRVVVFWF